MTTQALLPIPMPARREAPTLDPVQTAYAAFLARYSTRTRITYQGHLDQFLRWLGHHQLHPFDVKRAHIDLYLRTLEERGLASATRNSRFGVLHLFYRSAVADEHLQRDPTEHIERPRILSGEQRRTWLPPLDCLALLRAAQEAGPREHVLISLLGLVGMRVGAVCSLDISSVGRAQGWRTVTYRGKGGDRYTDVVPPQVSQDLEQLMRGRPSDAPLLLNESGRRLDRRSASTVLRNLCRQAQVHRDITPHGLRRSAVTNMLAQGIPARQVQQQVHHVDLKTTLAVYDRLKPTLDQSASLPYAASLYGMLHAE